VIASAATSTSFSNMIVQDHLRTFLPQVKYFRVNPVYETRISLDERDMKKLLKVEKEVEAWLDLDEQKEMVKEIVKEILKRGKRDIWEEKNERKEKRRRAETRSFLQQSKKKILRSAGFHIVNKEQQTGPIDSLKHGMEEKEEIECFIEKKQKEERGYHSKNHQYREEKK